jgi:hypothetical protein
MRIIVTTDSPDEQRAVKRAGLRAGLSEGSATEAHIVVEAWPYFMIRVDECTMCLCGKEYTSMPGNVTLSVKQVLEALS